MKIRSIQHLTILLAVLLSACNITPSQPMPTRMATLALATSTELPSLTPSPTFTEIPSTPTADISSPTPGTRTIAISESVPEFVQLSLLALPNVSLEPEGTTADLELVLDASNSLHPFYLWVLAAVVPFPTLEEEISSNQLEALWAGTDAGSFRDWSLITTDTTYAALVNLWGEPSGSLTVLPADDILSFAWEQKTSIAILPFEQLEPRWKVLTVDGQSPISNRFEPSTYPLTLSYAFSGDTQWQPEYPSVPATNRDPSRLTVFVMTGVTALVRATAHKMETEGLTYPGKDIAGWLSAADLTHTSNEVSFYSGCDHPIPYGGPLLFCSQPEYIDLLTYVGIDLVELTGNHNNDTALLYDVDAYPETLNLYDMAGMRFFGGGSDLITARTPLLIEHNGNRLALLGCNKPGPELAWATENSPGAAPCDDYAWMVAEIARLRAEGYLPVIGVQWNENYTNAASEPMEREFRSLIDAGAIIVNGSQAHTPKEMEFYEDGFIHYGLGNLFFDQMNIYESFLTIDNIDIPYTRFEFIDRHVFYDGRHVSTELLTALLEDYARPRPTTFNERNIFLTDIFAASGW